MRTRRAVKEEADDLSSSILDNATIIQPCRSCRFDQPDGTDRRSTSSAACLDRLDQGHGRASAYGVADWTTWVEKSKKTQGSSPTVQASWPGGMVTTSPGPTSASEPSSMVMWSRPETT
jgi:hypothetical protein